MRCEDYIEGREQILGEQIRTPLETWEFMYAKHLYYARNGAGERFFDAVGAPDEFLLRHPEIMHGDR